MRPLWACTGQSHYSNVAQSIDSKSRQVLMKYHIQFLASANVYSIVSNSRQVLMYTVLFLIPDKC